MGDGRYGGVGRRGRVWAVIAIVLFGGLAAKLFVVQVIRHDLYRNKGEATRYRRWPIRAPRGNIYDRNGNPLALNLKLFSVAADPGLIQDADLRAQQLSPLLREPKNALAEKLRPERGHYVKLRKTVDAPVAEAVRDLRCPGVIVMTEWQRAYPYEGTAAALLGFVGTDNLGLAGIEAVLNRELRGRDGEMMVVLDGRLPQSRNQIPGRSVVVKEMIPGSSVALTIDLEIQAIAEEALGRAVTEANAKGGTAIVMDPQTGDILALATQPGFDPNAFNEYDPETWVSQAVASPYEPGSTYKMITACAAIEEGVMSEGQMYGCTGSRAVGGHTISCALHGGTRAHGTLDLDEMVVKSCNVGMATVAMALGATRLHYWAERLGFGRKTGIELAGESAGLLWRPETWSQVQVANVGFGQGISVTALQLASAYAAVANGGRLVRPRLVKMIVDAEGRARERERPEAEQVLSAATCARVGSALERVVEEGTGKRARIPGRRVAGKTGTAQKPTPEAGFRSGKYIGSFVGYAPVDDPRVVILVSIDEPKGSHYGGVVAAPAFREICERSLAYMRIPPDGPVPEQRIAMASGG